MSGTTTFPTGFPGLTAARSDELLADDGAQNGILTVAQVVGQVLLTDLPSGGATTGQVLGYNSGAWGPVAAGGYTLPAATTITLGGVIVGANLAVSSGTLSLTSSPTVTGSLTTTGKIVAGGTAALVTIGADTISGSVAIGVPGTSTPYLDFQGAGVLTGYSARFIANASNTLRLISQTGTATLAVTGSLAANFITLTGSQSQSAVFAAPSGGAGAPSFRAIVPGDIPGIVPNTITVAAGGALTGGGALSANQTITLGTIGAAASAGSATVAPTVTIDTYGRVTALGSVTITPAFSSLTGTPTTLGGYGITNGVANTRSITAGTGLTGGGDLSADRTLTLAAATTLALGGVIIGAGLGVTAGTISANVLTVAGRTGAVVLSVADVSGAVANTTSITAGTGLTGGGALSGNVTLTLANTTVTASSYGSASSVATVTVDAQGRLTAASSTAIAVDASAVTSGTFLASRIPTATTAATGGVAIGSGLTINAGTVGIVPSVAGLSAALDATIPAGTYDLGPFIQGGTVLNSYAHVVSGGTITLTGAIGAPGTYTAITGLSSLAVSTTADSVGTATAANVITAGSHLWLIVANTSTPLGGSVFFSVKVP